MPIHKRFKEKESNLKEQILEEEQVESVFIPVLHKIHWRFIELFAEKDLATSSYLVGFFFSSSGTCFISVCVAVFPPVPQFIFQ